MLEFVPTTVPTEATAQSSAAVDVILASMEVTAVKVISTFDHVLSAAIADLGSYNYNVFF